MDDCKHVFPTCEVDVRMEVWGGHGVHVQLQS